MKKKTATFTTANRLEIVNQHNQFSRFYLPCASFNIAAVMKTLNTFLKTSPSNMEFNFPDPFEAMMIID